MAGIKLPPKVTTIIGRLAVPMIPQATLRTLNVHMVRSVAKLRSEQVTIVAFVILGQFPQFDLMV